MYSSFTKHIIYPLYQICTNRNDLKNLAELEQIQWQPTDKIFESQWSKLQQILKHAYINVPYYKRVFDNLNLKPDDINSKNDFQKIPFLDKEMISKNFVNLMASNINKKQLIKDSTGGSTGVNLQFYYDRKCYERRIAIELRFNQWAGLDIGDKSVRLWGSHFDIDLKEKFIGKMLNVIFRQLFLPSYNLSDEMMKIYAKKILKYKPKCIIGYASSLYVFAHFLSKNNLEGILPKSIISSAEVLQDYQRELIESVFHTKIFNRYGCREFGGIAQECEYHKGLHLNAEHVFIEIINEEGYSCRPGEKGEIVVTDLDNYGFPFIRYRIGDIGIFTEDSCKCGRGLPLLEKIEGRIFDMIVGTNGNHLTGTFWTILLRTHIQGIIQFQVLQEKYGEIILKLVVNELFTEKEKQKILETIYDNCGSDMKIDIQLLENIPLSASGKQRFIISKISPNIR